MITALCLPSYNSHMHFGTLWRRFWRMHHHLGSGGDETRQESHQAAQEGDQQAMPTGAEAGKATRRLLGARSDEGGEPHRPPIASGTGSQTVAGHRDAGRNGGHL
jgi:hypothetical protein